MLIDIFLRISNKQNVTRILAVDSNNITAD